MGLKRPGTRSNLSLMITGLWSLLFLFVLIGGHLVIGLAIYSRFFRDKEAEDPIQSLLQFPEWSLWSLAAIAIIADFWIYHSTQKERKNIRRR